jgi:hypothetical protein
MANNPKFANETVNAEADAAARKLDNGYLRIYSGAQPATADTALSGNTLLAELRFNATSAPAAAAGVLTFNAIASDVSADATGTATFFRAFKSDGTSVVMDGTVGIVSGFDAIINATSIVAATQVDCSAMTFSVSKG